MEIYLNCGEKQQPNKEWSIKLWLKIVEGKKISVQFLYDKELAHAQLLYSFFL